VRRLIQHGPAAPRFLGGDGPRAPEHTEIYPTHFSGSACGKGMSGKPMSTLAFERRFNPFLTMAGEDEFVAVLARELPPMPADMTATLRVNQDRA
jgi:hydroxyacylglutathione hydrolase